MKNIELSSDSDWSKINEPESFVIKGNYAKKDVFSDFFSGAVLPHDSEISLERTRSLIQAAEVYTGTDFFDATELFFVEITPELASDLLNFNMENNRNITESYVASYARLMKEGRWGISAPLMFSDTGCLIDGQHRLSAVVRAQAPQCFLVILGLPSKVAGNIDRGRRRSSIDVTRMGGMTWVKNVHASTAKFMQAELASVRVSTHDPGNPYEVQELYQVARKIDTEHLISFLVRYEDGIKFAVDNIGQHGPKSIGPILSVIAKAYYCHPDKRERLKEFCICLRTGEVVQGNLDNAAMQFNTQMHTFRIERDSKGGANWSAKLQSEVIRYCQSALFSFLKGQSSKKLNPAKKDLFPLIDIPLIEIL